jgi:linoleoyl-CoA desaturase
MQKKATSPVAHLTPEDIEQLGRELDAIREQVASSRGARDAHYIRNVIDVQRKLELASRAVLLFSKFPPAWLLGTAGLAISKILENMEIGHNVMHGQWDWMRDPRSTPPPGSGTTCPPRSCGSTRTTSCTTPTPT